MNIANASGSIPYDGWIIRPLSLEKRLRKKMWGKKNTGYIYERVESDIKAY